MTSRRQRPIFLLALFVFAGALILARPARADAVLDARHAIDEAAIAVDRVRDETRRSGEFDSLLQRAKGVLIIPSFYKAGFILGGAYGDGVLLVRLPDGTFSDPAFYRMTAGSIGLQIGMNSSEIVFVLQTEKGLRALLNDEFKMGANVDLSVGTIGAGAEAATTTHVGNDIVAYSKSSGLFAGGSFEGAVIRPRKDWNAAVYGVDTSDPRIIIQRSGLRAAINLKDVLSKNVYPTEPAVDATAPAPPPGSGPSEPVTNPNTSPPSANYSAPSANYGGQ
jgi:lipid-binding SYLF domain-containing protein